MHRSECVSLFSFFHIWQRFIIRRQWRSVNILNLFFSSQTLLILLEPFSNLNDRSITEAAAHICNPNSPYFSSDFCVARSPTVIMTGRSDAALFVLSAARPEAAIVIERVAWLRCIEAARRVCPVGTFTSMFIYLFLKKPLLYPLLFSFSFSFSFHSRCVVDAHAHAHANVNLKVLASVVQPRVMSISP